VFVARLRQMAEYPHRLLVVSAALSQVKSPLSAFGRQSQPDYPIINRRACRTAGTVSLH
jgi:hypothetical protein